MNFKFKTVLGDVRRNSNNHRWVALWVLAWVALLSLFPHTAHANVVRPHHPVQHRQHYQQQELERDSSPVYFNGLELNPEQSTIVHWIMQVAKGPKMTEDLATSIVVHVYETADKMQVDPMLVLALMRLESRFNPTAISSHGAKGLMQVMAKVHKDKLQGRSPYDVAANIEVGVRVYTDCRDSHNGDNLKALNCYSGGGGKAYQKLFQGAQKQGNHYLVESLFALDNNGPGRRRFDGIDSGRQYTLARN